MTQRLMGELAVCSISLVQHWNGKNTLTSIKEVIRTHTSHISELKLPKALIL